MYNYTHYWQDMQQCNLNTIQFYSLQSQNVNCMQRVNDAFEQVICDAQQMMPEDLRKVSVGPPKSCYNCKHRRYGFYNLSEGACEMFSDTAYCIRMCIYSNRMYWEPRLDIDIKHSDTKTSISTELLQCNTNEETLEVARKHGLVIDLTKQENQPEKDLQAQIRIGELKRRLELLRIQQLQTNIVAAPKEPPKPEKKYTVYDLYDLVFPDDPIKAHFDAERKRIEEKYKKQEEIVDKLYVPEVRMVYIEPIHTVTHDDGSDLLEVMSKVMAWILVGIVLVCIFA